MAADDIIDWEQMYVLVDELGLRGYELQHFDVCKELWKTKVPASGQADTLQGELLREIEKLRCEAMDNGNINWDDNYAYFCDNLRNTFAQSGLFDEGYLDKLSKLLGFVKECIDKYIRKTEWEWGDIFADIIGAFSGGLLSLIAYIIN